MIDETNRQTDIQSDIVPEEPNSIDPLEPEHVSMENFNANHETLFDGLASKVKTAGTKGQIKLSNGDVLNYTVDIEGVMRDDAGDLIDLEQDSEGPIINIKREIIVEDSNKNKTKAWFKIGAVTFAAIMVTIGAAKFVSDHRPKNLN